jgi:hypothetical protein
MFSMASRTEPEDQDVALNGAAGAEYVARRGAMPRLNPQAESLQSFKAEIE